MLIIRQSLPTFLVVKANNILRRIVSYVSSPYRLEHCARHSHRLHDRHCQPDNWPSTRVAHFRTARHWWLLASAAHVGQVATRLAKVRPSPALGSSHYLWITCAV